VLNAITALARDTADPEQKWNLEELGGGIPAFLENDPTPDGALTSVIPHEQPRTATLEHSPRR